MRVIFLDIDGVVNLQTKKEITSTGVLYEWSGIQPQKIALLNQLCLSGNAVVVISSAWRFSHSAQQIQKTFDTFGFTGKIRCVTPILQKDQGWKTRGYEILMWLLLNWEFVDGFVMIDDGRHTSRIPIIERHLVQTTSEGGLLQEHVDKALIVLQHPWKP